MKVNHGFLIHGRKTKMKFLRAVKGCIRKDRIRTTEITAELQIYDVHDKITENKPYKQNGFEQTFSSSWRI